MLDKSNYLYKVSAAGRINIIGEHIDYCGGKVFPAALSLKNTVYVKPNGTNFINISWTTLPDKVSLDITKLESYKNLKYGNYQAGSALMWKNAGKRIVGCDMVQDCTIPFGSGLSSSAAIEVSTIAALAAVAGEQIDKVEIACLAQKAEREFVGVNCGIMDHYASACGKKDYAMLLDCNTLNCEYVRLNFGDYGLIIINCNKPHNLIESKYNERRAETEKALKLFQKHVDISCLAELTKEQFDKYAKELSGKILNRAKHVVEECNRVNLARQAMQTGDIVGLGKLLNQSHNSLKTLYEVSCNELDTLVDAALSHPACLGSRMIGAGFGGCTIAIVKTAEIPDFKEYVSTIYKTATGYTPTFYPASISDGLTVTSSRS
jgi:galactokinase